MRFADEQASAEARTCVLGCWTYWLFYRIGTPHICRPDNPSYCLRLSQSAGALFYPNATQICVTALSDDSNIS